MKWPWSGPTIKDRMAGIFKRLNALEEGINGRSSLSSMFYGFGMESGVLSRLRQIEDLLKPTCQCCKTQSGDIQLKQPVFQCEKCRKFLKGKRK